MIDPWDLLAETYFGVFFAIGLTTYFGIMGLLMFYVRSESYRQYVADWIQQNPRSASSSSQLSFKQWAKNYNVSVDPNYILAWGIVSRSFSTVYALVVGVGTSLLLVEHGLASLLDYDFPRRHPESMNLFINLNAFMLAYLFINISFHIGHQLQRTLDKGLKPASNLLPSTIHHLVATLSILQFIEAKQLPFISLCFAFAEIATVPLNLAWLSVKLEWIQDRALKWFYYISVALTWLLFLVLRIFSPHLLINYILTNLDQIVFLRPPDWIAIFVANPILVGLNYYWFYRLTLKFIAICKSPQVDDSSKGNNNSREKVE